MHTGWMSYRKESVNNYDTVMLGMQRVAYEREAACGVGMGGCYVWDCDKCSLVNCSRAGRVGHVVE